MKRTSRKPSTLSESLQRHLNAYALAASAAGVGMLALAQPAEAKIVYHRTHHVIGPVGPIILASTIKVPTSSSSSSVRGMVRSELPTFLWKDLAVTQFEATPILLEALPPAG